MFFSQLRKLFDLTVCEETQRSGRQAAMCSKRTEGTEFNGKSLRLLVLVAIFAISVMWLRWPKSPNVPDELVGTWRTSDPRYADRSLDIDTVTISFGTGPGTAATGFIQKVEGVPEGSRTLFTITYVEDGQEELCSFYYRPANGKTIVFKNQPDINWTNKQGRLRSRPQRDRIERSTHGYAPDQ
jgi:hypothetical protein